MSGEARLGNGVGPRAPAKSQPVKSNGVGPRGVGEEKRGARGQLLVFQAVGMRPGIGGGGGGGRDLGIGTPLGVGSLGTRHATLVDSWGVRVRSPGGLAVRQEDAPGHRRREEAGGRELGIGTPLGVGSSGMRRISSSLTGWGDVIATGRRLLVHWLLVVASFEYCSYGLGGGTVERLEKSHVTCPATHDVSIFRFGSSAGHLTCVKSNGDGPRESGRKSGYARRASSLIAKRWDARAERSVGASLSAKRTRPGIGGRGRRADLTWHRGRWEDPRQAAGGLSIGTTSPLGVGPFGHWLLVVASFDTGHFAICSAKNMFLNYIRETKQLGYWGRWEGPRRARWERPRGLTWRRLLGTRAHQIVIGGGGNELSAQRPPLASAPRAQVILETRVTGGDDTQVPESQEEMVHNFIMPVYISCWPSSRLSFISAQYSIFGNTPRYDPDNGRRRANAAYSSGYQYSLGETYGRLTIADTQRRKLTYLANNDLASKQSHEGKLLLLLPRPLEAVPSDDEPEVIDTASTEVLAVHIDDAPEDKEDVTDTLLLAMTITLLQSSTRLLPSTRGSSRDEPENDEERRRWRRVNCPPSPPLASSSPLASPPALCPTNTYSTTTPPIASLNDSPAASPGDVNEICSVSATGGCAGGDQSRPNPSPVPTACGNQGRRAFGDYESPPPRRTRPSLRQTQPKSLSGFAFQTAGMWHLPLPLDNCWPSVSRCHLPSQPFAHLSNAREPSPLRAVSRGHSRSHRTNRTSKSSSGAISRRSRSRALSKAREPSPPRLCLAAVRARRVSASHLP
ncbi:hypothetical protein B0H14DRAFT_2631891 [Mycena olivaceomarginata]|nr:hypothetical protein B0H14DRAFT_2631891 [Mycena olivaceomarginata]